ncbi:sensor histidine kinase [Nocardioides antri]|uniref:sensor histidine kinase n=1 Tax=Nocardioides antri TaxID=2607659 RepID=UPI00165F61B9|nr:sensor histidine kinase [Nocardioides antri]
MSTVRTRGRDALVLVLVVGVLLEVLTTHQDVPLELSVPVALAMTVPQLWGERRPVLVAAIVLGAWLLQALVGRWGWALEPQSELLPVCLVFWSLGAYLPRRQAVWSCVVALAAVTAHSPFDMAVLGPLMVGVFAGGRLMHSREQLARQLEAERAHAERYAVAEERTRIARELHDAVGHAISLMTIQAGAERLALGDDRPETARVLTQIERTGRQTMQEMRRLLGVLRTEDEEPDLSPQPGLAQIPALAERMRPIGLRVDVETEGEPRPVSPGVDISAYRVVQEALTNVLKHADGRRSRVRIRYLPHSVELEVTDDGRAAHAAQNGGGHGLAGMRERVSLYGGTLEAGPVPDGGWRLLARLPLEPAP